MRDLHQKKLTPKQAKSKAESYCAYQERSQQEVRTKLYDWGLHTANVESIISSLIEENFLNEERFTKAYVRGKFNLKGWGKIKIIQGLKLKQVSAPLIKIACKEEITPEAYHNRLAEVIHKKNKELHETDPYKRRNKLAQYAAGRGFELDLIWDVIQDLDL